jgi:prepilin-type processing-associated H-X9-DG protein
MVDTTTKTTCCGGRLYERKYLRSDQVYFCPASSDPSRTTDAVPLPLLSDTTNGYDTSYHFNPHWTRPTPGAAYSATNRGIAAYPKLSQYKSGRAMIVEYLYSVGTSSHRLGKAAGWNLAFADGHVTTAYSIDATNSLNAMVNTNNSWRRFDDIRDMLEAAATSRDPKANPRTGVVFPASGWDTYRVHPPGEY